MLDRIVPADGGSGSGDSAPTRRASSVSTSRAGSSRRPIWRARSKRFCATRGWRRPVCKLEITESAFIGDVRAAHTTLNRLQSIGIEWSIDDFGTGYSSLSYLHRLQADTVKIDRSFVSRLGIEESGAEMVCAIVGLAHNFGMEVVAEGVETAEQLACVRRLGCDYAQGFFFSKPLEAAAVEPMLTTQPWRRVLTEEAPASDSSATMHANRVN